jgi:hypothetical protein
MVLKAHRPARDAESRVPAPGKLRRSPQRRRPGQQEDAAESGSRLHADSSTASKADAGTCFS